jgi:hypothetical protein
MDDRDAKELGPPNLFSRTFNTAKSSLINNKDLIFNNTQYQRALNYYQYV